MCVGVQMQACAIVGCARKIDKSRPTNGKQARGGTGTPLLPNACVDARLFAIILRMCVHVMHLYHISYVSLSTYPGNEFNIKISHMVASEVATRLSL